MKSSYFIQLFFTYVNEAQKLKIIKNNKSLQKTLKINIINYKHFKGRYIIFEENGIAKEYNGYDNSLFFEGEYLDGQKYGKGKEYNENGSLIFEGEYFKGKKEGYGREYFSEDGSFFEGKYYNNKKRSGSKYNNNGNLIYKLNNNINGVGIEYDDNGNFLSFEGKYNNGKRSGRGKEYYKNGKIKFKGEYLNGIRWKGKGYDTRNNVVYDIKNGRGLIKEYNKYNSIIFEGEYNNGEKNGKGKEYYYDGKLSVLKYEGEYLNGKKNGKGKEYNQDGELIFEGDYLYGFRLKGKEYINNRVEFEGEFLYGKKWNGKEYDESDNEIYEIINGNIKGKKDDINERLILKNIFIYNKFENYLI